MGRTEQTLPSKSVKIAKPDTAKTASITLASAMDVGGICAMNTVNFGATKNTVTLATSSPMVMKTKAPSCMYALNKSKKWLDG